MAQLRVLIQRAAISAQCRGEQLQKSISDLSARIEVVGGGQPGATGLPAERIDEQARQRAFSNLPLAVRRAYLSYQAALVIAEKSNMEDWEAYDLLKENGIPEGTQGELTDYRLPARDTWCRYLRRARHALGEQKNTPSHGRPHGGSIVRQDQIEQPDNDDK